MPRRITAWTLFPHEVPLSLSLALSLPRSLPPSLPPSLSLSLSLFLFLSLSRMLPRHTALITAVDAVASGAAAACAHALCCAVAHRLTSQSLRPAAPGCWPSAVSLVERNDLSKLLLCARQERGIELIDLGLSQHMRRNRQAARAIENEAKRALGGLLPDVGLLPQHFARHAIHHINAPQQARSGVGLWPLEKRLEPRACFGDGLVLRKYRVHLALEGTPFGGCYPQSASVFRRPVASCVRVACHSVQGCAGERKRVICWGSGER